MNKIISAFALLILVSLLHSCNPKSDKGFNEKNIIGVWSIDQYDINGTVLPHESIGAPRIEFRGDEYHINTAGDVEKGKYVIADSILKFDCTSNPDKPDNEFIITRLDSAVVEYYSQTDNNRMVVTLLKIHE